MRLNKGPSSRAMLAGLLFFLLPVSTHLVRSTLNGLSDGDFTILYICAYTGVVDCDELSLTRHL